MRDMRMRSVIVAATFAGVAVVGGPAAAQLNPADQHTRYNVQDINFDLWCQETAKLPPDRCDKRTPQDDAAFNAYRASIEKYELDYLKQKNSDHALDRLIIHADPSPNEAPENHPADRENDGPTSQP